MLGFRVLHGGGRVRTRSRNQLAAAIALLLFGCSSSGGSKTTPPPPPGTPRSLSGTVTYDFVPAVYVPGTGGGLNFAGAVRKPVRAATVQVMKGATVLATTTTDASGHYALSYTEPAGAGALAVVALAESTGPNIAVVDNTDGQSTWAMGAPIAPAATTQDLHAGHGWTGSAYDPAARGAAPFAVLDSMYTAARAFLAVRSVAFPDLVVNWSPNNTPAAGNKALGQIGTSHFSPQENQIYILGKEGIDTDEFDSHVIVHEWAHYFEKNLSRSDSPGGPHGNGDVLDPRLAFGEGYGNALAAMLLPETVYADTLWSGGNIVAAGFDAETEPNPTDDPNAGPFSETSVMRLLYDLYDAGAGEGFDTVGVGLGVIYDVLTGPERTTQALTTIGSFIAGLKAHPSVTAPTRAAIDTLLANYAIGPITDEWGTGDANLLAMYAGVSAFPASGSVLLGGGFDSNKWQQNQYYVFTGNGAQVTASATSAEDVVLVVYQAGTRVAAVDANTTGTETVHVSTVAGKVYVVNLIGFGPTPGDYNVNVSFTSP